MFGYEYGDRPTADFSYATLLLGGQQVAGGIGGYPAATAGHSALTIVADNQGAVFSLISGPAG